MTKLRATQAKAAISEGFDKLANSTYRDDITLFNKLLIRNVWPFQAYGFLLRVSA